MLHPQEDDIPHKSSQKEQDKISDLVASTCTVYIFCLEIKIFKHQSAIYRWRRAREDVARLLDQGVELLLAPAALPALLRQRYTKQSECTKFLKYLNFLPII